MLIGLLIATAFALFLLSVVVDTIAWILAWMLYIVSAPFLAMRHRSH